MNIEIGKAYFLCNNCRAQISTMIYSNINTFDKYRFDDLSKCVHKCDDKTFGGTTLIKFEPNPDRVKIVAKSEVVTMSSPGITIDWSEEVSCDENK